MSDSHREQPVYLVTGAGSGIGRAFVELVAEDPNVQVALLGRRFDALEETLHLAGLDSCRAMAIGCDVADWDAVGSAVDVSVRRWGALTGAFNAAGTFGVFDKLGDEDPAKVKEVIDTNLFGSWVCLSHEARVMRPQRGGAIVMTGSIASFQGHTRSAIYAATTIIHWTMRALHVTPGFLQSRWERAVRRYEKLDTERMADFTMRDPENWTVSRTELFPTRDVPFEDITVMLPREYDTLLRRGYGDYMQLPPEEERRNHKPHTVDFGPYALTADRHMGNPRATRE